MRRVPPATPSHEGSIMKTKTSRRDKRYLIQNLAAKLVGITAPMTWEPGWSRVLVGPARFDLELFGYGGTRQSPKRILAVASDRDHIAVREVTRTQVDSLEDNMGCYDSSPDPWGDANALEAMARHIVGVDCVSVGRSQRYL